MTGADNAYVTARKLMLQAEAREFSCLAAPNRGRRLELDENEEKVTTEEITELRESELKL